MKSVAPFPWSSGWSSPVPSSSSDAETRRRWHPQRGTRIKIQQRWLGASNISCTTSGRSGVISKARRRSACCDFRCCYSRRGTTRFVIRAALHLSKTSHSRATGRPQATIAMSWVTNSPGSAVPTPIAASCCKTVGISRSIAGTARIHETPLSLTGTRSAPSRALTRWPRLSPIVHLSPPRCRSCYRLRCTAIVASRTASQS
mmetsp:Transcript_56516/g.150313  ORF Transcript_56516/g.150313 Transcript_56516/m.150313 type:complete len:202 (+) Transcript_56516:295-900(+)